MTTKNIMPGLFWIVGSVEDVPEVLKRMRRTILEDRPSFLRNI